MRGCLVAKNTDPPKTDDDIRKLAVHVIACTGKAEPGEFVTYLVSTCRFDAKRVQRVLKAVWPEAAAKVQMEN